MQAEEKTNYCVEYTQKIKQSLHRLAKEYSWIGFLLEEMLEYKYYLDGGYSSIYEYGLAELGFKKSSINNFINVYRTFCYGPNPPREHKRGGFSVVFRPYDLKAEWEAFNYSQLCEMLSMTERQRESISPEMSVRNIREYKKGESPVFQTSGKSLVLEKYTEIVPLDGKSADEIQALLSRAQGIKSAIVFYE